MGEAFREAGNLGHKIRSQEGYFPVPPSDTHGDLRAMMVMVLESLGISTSSTTTRSAGPARARSTCASRRCCGWRTR